MDKMDRALVCSSEDKRRRALLRHALALLRMRDYTSAADQFAILVEENPGRREYVVNVVGCRILAREPSRARAQIEQARRWLDDSRIKEFEAFLRDFGCDESRKIRSSHDVSAGESKVGGAYHYRRESTPLVSVIVPAYNAARYVEACLLSITKQFLNDIELLVVDDGSEDKSGEIIDRLARSDGRIRAFHNAVPSGNPGNPRNQALRHARGRYIAFVDSDDWIEPDMLSRLSRRAEETGADIVFTAGFFDHRADGTKKRKYGWEFTADSEIAWRYHESFMIWDKLYRRTFLQENKILLGETKAAGDVPFIFKAYYYANVTSTLVGYTGYHYRRETEQSVTVRHRKGSDCEFEISAYDSVEEWFSSINGDSRYRAVIDFRKAMSFAYALNLVRPEAFGSLYSRMRSQLKEIDRNRVAELASAIGAPRKLEQLDDIRRLSWREYAAKYRRDITLEPARDAAWP